jgi:cytochrome c oxidase subunit 1
MGMLGMPRRYSNVGEYEFLKNAHGLVLFVTIAAIITVIVQLLFYFNFIWSIFKGKKAPNDNPWEATTLEWTIPSPPPHDNFAGIMPTVYHGPYEFSVPGAPNDYIMQTEPEGERVAPDVGDTSGNGGNGHKH